MNMEAVSHSKSCIASNANSKARKAKGRKKVVTKVSGDHGSSNDHEDEVIVWHAKKDLLGEGASTSGCSGPQDKLIGMPNPSVKISDSLSSRQLQSSKELQTKKECASKVSFLPKQYTQTVCNKPQRNKGKAPDKNEQSGDTVTGGGALGKKEAKRNNWGIQNGVPDKIKQKQSGNSVASKGHAAKSAKKHDNEKIKVNGPLHGNVEMEVNGGPKINNGVLNHNMQWRVKISPETDEKGDAQLKHAKLQDGDSQELGEGDISVSYPFCPNLSMKVQDSLPLEYVPLEKLQISKESKTRKECESKISGSKQHPPTAFNMTQKSKDNASDKNEERQSRVIGIGDGVLDKNNVRQTWRSGIEDGAPDKNEQRESGNLGASKGQKDRSGKKCEMVRINGKTIVKGPLHDSIEMSGRKLEQCSDRKEHEASKQGNKNDHKGSLLRGASSSKGTTGRSNQGRESFENAKEIEGNGDGRRKVLGSGTDVERKFILKHVNDQNIASEETGEGGISVSCPFPFENGRPQSIKRGREQTVAIIISNNGKNSVKLFAAKLVNSRPSNSFSLSHAEGPFESMQFENKSYLSSMYSLEVKNKSMIISQLDIVSLSLVGCPWLVEPGQHLIIHLLCIAKDIGLHRSCILFDFQDQKIIRCVTLLAEDDVCEQLAPTEPYSRSRRRKQSSFTTFIPGTPPPLPNFPKKVHAYPIPEHLKNMTDGNESELPKVLKEGLSMRTYSNYFSTLLYLEELQMQENIRAYDMHNATMSSNGQYLVLKVPGLSEKRPSLVYRDQIYVTASEAKGNTYQGYIHRIEANEIYVKFDKSFHQNFLRNRQYDVHFSFSRINLRRCHQAMAAVADRIDESLLFPCRHLVARMTCGIVSKSGPFNRRLNMEQLSAVQEIINCYGFPPYLVYGPPGTGKTATLVEAILQIISNNSKARILACAPSNVASDLLVERLLGPLQKSEIFRLNAISRPYQDVPHHILPYCYYEDSNFYCPPVGELLKYKIIISTYLSAAILDAQSVPKGHFTHIFLDESGQGTEPETMVPIANLATAETTVVLAGDPRQLGPIIYSNIAEKFGLGKSYFERLSDLDLYCPDGNNKEFVTKLVRNYRSHPAILELPSRLFYGNELIACAADGIQNLHCGWDQLPNKKFPVVFVGIEGCDEREGKSPSWFNTIEVSKVLEIIQKIKDVKRNSVNGKDIGVITPYRQQVCKLKKVFAANSLTEVKVGSVEQFQGDEKRVIIISTVRSSFKNQGFDKKYNLGFIGNPKRFNVAVTRAKSLLVVVGNPYILCKDTYWNELLQYCVSHKSYLGCPLPAKQERHEFIPMDELPPGEYSVDSGTSGHMSIKFTIEDMEGPDGTR